MGLLKPRSGFSEAYCNERFVSDSDDVLDNIILVGRGIKTSSFFHISSEGTHFLGERMTGDVQEGLFFKRITSIASI